LDRNLGGSVDSFVFFRVNAGIGFSNDSILWDFGPDATPRNIAMLDNYGMVVTGSTAYSTPGEKTITFSIVSPAGCSKMITFNTHIYDCTSPQIPKRAIVIDSSSSPYPNGAVLWVNPGVQHTFHGDHDTIFAEPGSSIEDEGTLNVVYLKPGATYHGGGNGTLIIYANGASVSPDVLQVNVEIPCPTLNFDYTNAPPNKIVIDGISQPSSSPSVEVFPNPTQSYITVSGLSLGASNITVYDILGNSVLEAKNSGSTSLQLDLTKLAPGTYYVRVASPNSVITKKVIRE
jgi:hypothetical protein